MSCYDKLKSITLPTHFRCYAPTHSRVWPSIPVVLQLFWVNTMFFFLILGFSSLTLGYLSRIFVKKSITLPFIATTRPILSFLTNIKTKLRVLCFLLTNTTTIGCHTLLFLRVLRSFFLVSNHVLHSSSMKWCSITDVFRSIGHIFEIYLMILRILMPILHKFA